MAIKNLSDLSATEVAFFILKNQMFSEFSRNRFF